MPPTHCYSSAPHVLDHAPTCLVPAFSTDAKSLFPLDSRQWARSPKHYTEKLSEFVLRGLYLDEFTFRFNPRNSTSRLALFTINSANFASETCICISTTLSSYYIRLAGDVKCIPRLGNVRHKSFRVCCQN